MKATFTLKLENEDVAVEVPLMELSLLAEPEKFQDTLKRNFAQQMPQFMEQAFTTYAAAVEKHLEEVAKKEAEAEKKKAEAAAKKGKKGKGDDKPQAGEEEPAAEEQSEEEQDDSNEEG